MTKPARTAQFLACSAVGIFILTFLILLPIANATLGGLADNGINPQGWPLYLTTLSLYLIGLVSVGWYFFLGACIASFLNVVALRLPVGKTILGGSACPNCQAPLAFFDKIPIYSWFRFGGRCRHCLASIPKRYLAVEVILGLFFAAFTVSLANSKVSILMEPEFYETRVEDLIRLLVMPTPFQRLQLLYGWCLGSMIFLIALIDIGHQRVNPRWLFLPIAGNLALVFSNHFLLPLGFWRITVGQWWEQLKQGADFGLTLLPLLLASQFIGAVTGWIVANGCNRVLHSTSAANSRPARDGGQEPPNDNDFLANENTTPHNSFGLAESQGNTTLSMVIIGMFLGWQGVAVAGLISLLCFITVWPLQKRYLFEQPSHLRAPGFLAAATFLILLIV